MNDGTILGPWLSTTLGEAVAETGGLLQTGPFGSQLHASDYSLVGTPLIMPVNLGDNVIREAGIARVNAAHAARLHRHALREGDIVFSRRGEVGRRSIVRRREAGWLCGTGCLAARFGTRRAEMSPEFVALFLGLPSVQTWLLDNAVGGTMPNLNTSILASTPVRIPTRQDQDAIVAALTEANDLISANQQLIAKKQAIQQGMLQQLLTGRTRLPGFTDKWREARLVDISTMKGRIGWQGLTQDEFTSDARQPFLITGMNFKDGAIRWDEVYHVPEQRYAIAPEIQLRIDDVLMTKDGTIGKLLYVDAIPSPAKATLNSHLLVFRPKNLAYVPRFLYYQLSSPRFAKHVELYKSGTTFFGISQESVGKYQMLLPSLEEQAAIARVLLESDVAIEALNKRRAKATAIKVGMMQQLLTGGARLPVGEVS
jgi:type I restriction enzyme S subunit